MDTGARRRWLILRGASLVVVVSAWMFVRFRRRCLTRPPITYAPLSAREAQRQNNLNFIYNSDDTRCVDLLRMRRVPFFQLCDLLRNRELLKDTGHCTVEEQMVMFLHVVGHNQRLRVINLTFRRSFETISRHFQEVLYAVGELRQEMIQPPSTAVPPKIGASRRWNPYFKDCVGAIDGTHVLARVPRKIRAAFLGRKHTTTQNVLAAVDFDLRFTYVLAGWEGSAHDALILVDALEREDGLRVPPGKFYLVDAGYAVRPGFLPPYRGTRYHLREFGTRVPRNPRELFNLRHSSLRTTVERMINEEDAALMHGMTDAIWGFASAVADAAHSEVYPGTYEACMGTPGFLRPLLMKALNHLTANKATAIQFVKMTPEDRDLWMHSFLSDNHLV